MPITYTDARPDQFKGDLDWATLVAIMNNSLGVEPWTSWNNANTTVTVTKGAHEGTHYFEPVKTDYYFDITVPGSREMHCLLHKPATDQSSVAGLA